MSYKTRVQKRNAVAEEVKEEKAPILTSPAPAVAVPAPVVVPAAAAPVQAPAAPVVAEQQPEEHDDEKKEVKKKKKAAPALDCPAYEHLENAIKVQQHQYQESHKEVMKALKETQTFIKGLMRTKKRKIADVAGDVAQQEPKLNGIARPRPVSEEFARFFGLNADDKKSLTAMSKMTWKYVKDHNLQDPKDKRVVLCDDALLDLLKPDGNQVKYHLLARYLRLHQKYTSKGAANEDDAAEVEAAA